MRYLRNVLVAATQLLGALTGITLNANESTSGAAYRKRNDGYNWLYKGINGLFFWQENHCLEAVIRELIDSKEIEDAYDGFAVQPVPVQLVVAKPEKVAASDLSPTTKSKIYKAQSEARKEEATDLDPMSPGFNIEGWFDGLPDKAKRRIVEVGVSIKMSKDNRKKVFHYAMLWWNSDAVGRSGHGMTSG